jgi:hypothetical protein
MTAGQFVPYAEAVLYSIARRWRCPDLWCEDCVQEMRVHLALRPDDPHSYTCLKSIAVDYARKFGPFSRSGALRDYSYLPGDGSDNLEARDEISATEAVIDFRAAWQVLSPKQQEALTRAAHGLGAGWPSDWTHRMVGRRRLRRLLA